jgi:hypothetical protein
MNQSRSVLLLFYNQTKNRMTLFYLSNTERSYSILESGAESFHSIIFQNQTPPKAFSHSSLSIACDVRDLNVFLDFQILPNLKFKTEDLLMSKIYQTLHNDNFKHKEHLSFLDQLQLPLEF